MCRCIYVHTYIHMPIQIHIYIYTCTHVYQPKYLYAHVCICLYLHVYVSRYLNIWLPVGRSLPMHVNILDRGRFTTYAHFRECKYRKLKTNRALRKSKFPKAAQPQTTLAQFKVQEQTINCYKLHKSVIPTSASLSSFGFGVS